MSWSLVRALLLCSLAVIGSSSRSVHSEAPPNQDPFGLNAAEEASVDADQILAEVEVDLKDGAGNHQRDSSSSPTYTKEETKQVSVDADKDNGESTNRDKKGVLGGTSNSKNERLYSGCLVQQLVPFMETSQASHNVNNGITQCMTMHGHDETYNSRGSKSKSNLEHQNEHEATDVNHDNFDKYWSCSKSELPRSSNNLTHSQGCFSSFDTITHMNPPDVSISDANQSISTPENCLFSNRTKAMICSGSQVKQVPAFFGEPDDLQYLVFDNTRIFSLDSTSIEKFPRTETLALLNGILFRVEFAPLLNRVHKEIIIVNNSLSGLNFSWFFESEGNNTSTVTILNLMDNMITYLPDPNTGTDPVLPNLTTVILSNNPLKVLPVHVFRPLRHSQVKCLSLRSCCIEDFGSQDNISSPLQYLTKLQTLDLSENFLLGTERLAKLLAPLGDANLSTLRLSGNNYLYTPYESLKHVAHSLIVLDLHSSSFSCLDINSFPYMHKLETLHLDFSRITTIMVSTFSSLPSLRSLSLEGNGLMSVPAALRLPSLTHLSLSGNPRIEDSQGKCLFSLSLTSFSGMNNLTSLNMAEIPLVSLKTDQFIGLSSLTELSLNATSLEMIDPGSFRGLRNLRKLFLNKNALSILMNGTFEDLENLSLLDLSYNRLSFSNNIMIPVSSNASEISQENTRSRTSKKDCLPNETSGNQINAKLSIPDTERENLSFSTNDNLDTRTPKAGVKSREIRGIGELNSNLTRECGVFETSQNLRQNDWPFRDLAKLEVLILNDNRITGMFPVFDELSSLTMLDLNNNKIYEWEERLFSGCRNLRFLNLKDNQIRTLTDAMVQDFNSGSLELINLYSNHFECSCDLKPFADDLDDEHFVDFECYECSSGKSNLQLTTYLSELVSGKCDDVADTLGSVNPTVLTLAISLCVLLLTGSFVLGIYRSRRCKPLQVGTNAASVDLELETQFEYDVFVCYAFQEKQWVFQVLLPVFEKQLQLDVCIHERDFQAGDLITENIEYSIKTSRKVLFVVSRAFLASQWCQYELNRAVMLALRDNGSKLLLLEKEVVPKEELSSSLETLLKTRTFISWSENSEEQKLVWDKFRKVLVPQSRPPKIVSNGNRRGISILRQFLRLGASSTASASRTGGSNFVPTHQSFRRLGPSENGPVRTDARPGRENPCFTPTPIRPLRSFRRETNL